MQQNESFISDIETYASLMFTKEEIAWDSGYLRNPLILLPF
jgi:hypothetical protein